LAPRQAADWASVHWQRVNCIKNIKGLRALMGDLLTDAFYVDLERDQAERATMSMLVTPQMMNTMVPCVPGSESDASVPRAGEDFTRAFYADPVRRYMLPVFSDRRVDWPSHPYSTRDSLHEHDMWAVEGLTHRYPPRCWPSCCRPARSTAVTAPAWTSSATRLRSSPSSSST
jgi:lysine 2,3-aminomutase